MINPGSMGDLNSNWEGFLPENSIVMGKQVGATELPSVDLPNWSEYLSSKAEGGLGEYVFLRGNPQSSTWVISETSNPLISKELTEEDLKDREAVRELSQKMFQAIQLSEEDYFSIQFFKTTDQEVLSFLKDQVLELVNDHQPDLILGMGNLIFKQFFPEEKRKLTEFRGTPVQMASAQWLSTFHPAYLLKNPNHKRLAWEDLKLFKSLI